MLYRVQVNQAVNGFGVLAEERLVSLVSCIIATHSCMIESFHWTFQSGEEGLIRWPAKAQAVMLQPDWGSSTLSVWFVPNKS
jgi:hypothetical protein